MERRLESREAAHRPTHARNTITGLLSTPSTTVLHVSMTAHVRTRVRKAAPPVATRRLRLRTRDSWFDRSCSACTLVRLYSARPARPRRRTYETSPCRRKTHAPNSGHQDHGDTRAEVARNRARARSASTMARAGPARRRTSPSSISRRGLVRTTSSCALAPHTSL
jgi:hypothetical protein